MARNRVHEPVRADLGRSAAVVERGARQSPQTTSHIRQQKANVGHQSDLGRQVDAGSGHSRANIQLLLVLVVLAQVAEFSVVGGALLARYMIPAIPLVVLMAVDVLRRYAPQWQWWIAGCAAAFVAALLLNPPWFISPEDNLTWTHFVAMHQQAARYVEQHYAEDRILTAWPASDELNRPFLGYVEKPLTVVRVENFTAEEMLRAATAAGELRRGGGVLHQVQAAAQILAAHSRLDRVQTRYFDFHQDLAAASIARLLHGRIVWQESSPGEWIAVIEIDKMRNAEFKVSTFQGFDVSRLERR